MAVLLSCGDAGVEDVDHDVVQTLVNLLEGPAQTQGVLAHFQTGGSNAACVSSLCRAEEYACCLECCNSLRSRRHVGALSYELATVGDQSLCVLLVQLVLGCARQSDVALYAPRTLALGVNAARYALSVLLDAAALYFLDVLDNIEVDAVRIVDEAVGVGHGNDLGAQLGSLLAGVDCNVAGTGDSNSLALERGALVCEHFLHVVAQAVAGSLGTSQRTAVGQALAGQNAGVLVAQTLVLAEHKADLTAAYTDVTSRNVGELTDVLAQLGHEGLAETHDLSIGLALRVEVGAALAAAHREGGQAVLEALLEAEELDNRSVNRGMQTQAALVGADRGVELNAEAAVYANLALIVNPRNTEHEHALRLYDALHDAVLLQLGASFYDRLQALEDFVNCLLKLRLVRVALFDSLVNALQIGIGKCHFGFPPCNSAAVPFHITGKVRDNLHTCGSMLIVYNIPRKSAII